MGFEFRDAIDMMSSLQELPPVTGVVEFIPSKCIDDVVAHTETSMVLDSRIFYEPPKSYHIDDLASFALLGIDVKITPNNKVNIIEVNGSNCGMRGFAQAGVTYASFLRTIGFDGVSADYSSSCEIAAAAHIHNLGVPVLAFIAAMAPEDIHFTPERFPHRYDVPTGFFGWLDRHGGWKRKYKGLMKTVYAVERTFQDKLLCDWSFRDCRDLKVRTHICSHEGWSALKEEHNPEYVVAKPQNGSMGEGINIWRAEEVSEMINYAINWDRRYVLEPFIASKPITFSGDDYDGCMRYVVFVEEKKDGSLNLFAFGGYWRLCPLPMRKYGECNAMCANLSANALPAHPSNDELVLVTNELKNAIPVFYRRLMQDICIRTALSRKKLI